MTIGWGLVGILFRNPVFTVAMRRPRRTYKLMNETGVYTVNVPNDDVGDAIDFLRNKVRQRP
jgi:flavin reductase (DIM6/NTAB) family NADH-FMN oxidoreductase RutF